MTFDGKAFGAEIVAVVKEYMGKELTPILTRLDDLQKQIEAIPQPVDLSSELTSLKQAVDAIVIPDIPELPELPDIPKMIDEAIEARVNVEDMERSIEEVVRLVVAEVPLPKDGKDGSSVTVDDVAPLIAAEVEKRVSDIPKPKDGKDGVDGKDGLDVSDLFRAEGGKLIAVMSDGRIKDLGTFVGKDGEPGKDGQDGVGFDDLSASYDGEKTITIRFSKGDRVKEFDFAMPVVIDRGVFKDGSEYKAGDGVTWGGSFWIAQKDTGAKPDAGSDWRLSVKRGRDGKDAGGKDVRVSQPVRIGTPASGD